MKNIITLAAAVFASSLFAAVHTLAPGANRINDFGEIVAIEANTIDASQMVTVSVVTAVNEYTNAYRDVTSRHTRYDFTITNFDGAASIATNTIDRFSYADWISTNGISRIVGTVSPSAFIETNRVENGQLLKATYTHRAEAASGTASDHYLKASPANTFIFFGSGVVDCQCGDGDAVRIYVR